MKIKFEPRDLWIGIFWDRCKAAEGQRGRGAGVGRTTTLDTDQQHYRIYVCIVPCFPIIFEISRRIPPHRRAENW